VPSKERQPASKRSGLGTVISAQVACDDFMTKRIPDGEVLLRHRCVLVGEKVEALGVVDIEPVAARAAPHRRASRDVHRPGPPRAPRS